MAVIDWQDAVLGEAARRDPVGHGDRMAAVAMCRKAAHAEAEQRDDQEDRDQDENEQDWVRLSDQRASR